MVLKEVKLIPRTTKTDEILDGAIHHEFIPNLKVISTEMVKKYQLVKCKAHRTLPNEVYETDIHILIEQLSDDLMRAEIYL